MIRTIGRATFRSGFKSSLLHSASWLLRSLKFCPYLHSFFPSLFGTRCRLLVNFLLPVFLDFSTLFFYHLFGIRSYSLLLQFFSFSSNWFMCLVSWQLPMPHALLHTCSVWILGYKRRVIKGSKWLLRVGSFFLFYVYIFFLRGRFLLPLRSLLAVTLP